jgi:hypothetical protein
MALTGRECGHQYRPDVRFCIVCGADRPEPAEQASAYQPTMVRQPASAYQGAPAYQAVPAYQGPPAYQAVPAYQGPPAYQPPPAYQAAPVHQAAPVRYQPPAAPVVPGQVLPGPPGPPPDRPRRLRGVLIGLATFLAAGGVTAAVMLIAHPLHRGATPSPGGTPAASAPVSASSPAAQPTQEAAAQGLAGLLAQSVMDRSSIVAAVTDVSRCGPNLRQDPQTFQSAVASRQALLTRLAGLPGRSVLPAPMLAALTSAWQNSIQADQDFAQWAKDEIASGCTSGNQSADPNARAAATPDAQATTAKRSFVAQWNPIAARYGLPAYRWNQL